MKRTNGFILVLAKVQYKNNRVSFSFFGLRTKHNTIIMFKYLTKSWNLIRKKISSTLFLIRRKNIFNATYQVANFLTLWKYICNVLPSQIMLYKFARNKVLKNVTPFLYFKKELFCCSYFDFVHRCVVYSLTYNEYTTQWSTKPKVRMVE